MVEKPPPRQPSKRRSKEAKRRIVITRGREDLRNFVTATIRFFTRVEVIQRAIYAGDLDLARVSNAVGLGAIEHRVRDPGFHDEFSDYQHIIGVEGQRGVNATSVAAATGMPRETVRRKLRILVDHGVLLEKTRGRYVLKPGFLQDPRNLALIEEGMRYAAQYMNDCIAHGVFHWKPESK